jgi:hypothetical protein
LIPIWVGGPVTPQLKHSPGSGRSATGSGGNIDPGLFAEILTTRV